MFINSQKLAREIAGAVNITETQAAQVLGYLASRLAVHLSAGMRVRLYGIGTFSVRERKARTGVNPRNPTEKIQIPAVKVVKYTASSTLKGAVRDSRGGGDSTTPSIF